MMETISGPDYVNVFKNGHANPERTFDPWNNKDLTEPVDGNFLFINNYAYAMCKKWHTQIVVTNFSSTKVLKIWWVVTDADDLAATFNSTLSAKQYLNGGNVKTLSIPPQQARTVKVTCYPGAWIKRDRNTSRFGKYALPTLTGTGSGSPNLYTAWSAPNSETFLQMFAMVPNYETGDTVKYTVEARIWQKIKYLDRRDIYLIDAPGDKPTGEETEQEFIFTNNHIETLNPSFHTTSA